MLRYMQTKQPQFTSSNHIMSAPITTFQDFKTAAANGPISFTNSEGPFVGQTTVLTNGYDENNRLILITTIPEGQIHSYDVNHITPSLATDNETPFHISSDQNFHFQLNDFHPPEYSDEFGAGSVSG